MNTNPFESTAQLRESSSLNYEENNSQQFLSSIYDSVQTSIFVVDVLENGDFRYVALNPTHEQWIGISSEQLKGKTPEEILSPIDAVKVRQHYTDCVRFGKTIDYEQCLQFKGVPTWWSTTLTPLRDGNSQIYRLVGTSTNITERKQAQLARELQLEQEQLLRAIQERLSQCLDLDVILNETVTELRRFLMSDRVLIYCFGSDSSGDIITESTVTVGRRLLGTNIKDPCFKDKHLESYKRGCIEIVEDIYKAGLAPCYIDLLASFKVRANLVVPILLQQDLWGLLIAQHCTQPRQWQQTEIDLVQQVAIQLGIAVQQSQLHQQVQHLSGELDLMQQFLDCEVLVRRLTEQMRDSLDASQVLQTATRELTKVLSLDCQIELYSPCGTFATVTNTTPPLSEKLTRKVAEFPQIYQPLLQKELLEFEEIVCRWNRNLVVVTKLICPIFDAQEVLGNIWLIKPRQEKFSEFEITLVQQVANQCAIAIRQARLYQTTQQQSVELKKLELLKNEFLKSLSHELRTPITSISLASQTLESVLKQEGLFDIEPVPQLLHILQNECGRESKLINDLLSLTYLDADTDPLTLIPIDLQTWLPPIVEPFRERMSCQQQQLHLSIETQLPALNIDITDLERILTELLNNACKYTPAGGAIAVSAYSVKNGIFLSVSNSGVEIATNQLSRIFDPFYRIPNHDPWKFGGTGLGLALVQKLVKHLGATIHVHSAASKTTFTIQFPLA